MRDCDSIHVINCFTAGVIRMKSIFKKDELTKRERVLNTLLHRELDRVAIHEQLSFNPGVISMYTGKKIDGFDYTLEDIGKVISMTLDMAFVFFPPCGTDQYTDEYGFVFKNDNWTRWHVSRPFADEHGAAIWFAKFIANIKNELKRFDADAYRHDYHARMKNYHEFAGDTVILDICTTGFCEAYDRMGLEIYAYFLEEYAEMLKEYMEVSTDLAVKRAKAVGPAGYDPVILIAEDFSSKRGPIFNPDFLKKYHFPYVKRLTAAWHDNGFHVIYHSDGNYKTAIPELIACGVDGFYCLEPNAGMDVVELKNAYPQMAWAGGIDGVDLLERGSPDEVKAEVFRQILETDALRTGGMFLASSSEINPTVKPENFRAMIEAADLMRN